MEGLACTQPEAFKPDTALRLGMLLFGERQGGGSEGARLVADALSDLVGAARSANLSGPDRKDIASLASALGGQGGE